MRDPLDPGTAGRLSPQDTTPAPGQGSSIRQRYLLMRRLLQDQVLDFPLLALT